MTFERFADRMKTIWMLKNKIDKVNDFLTLAFSDDIKYNKIYADGFNFLEDKLINDLAEDLYVNSELKKEDIKSSIEYFIYEIDFAKDKRQFYYTVENEKKTYDCTIYNTYLELMNRLPNEVGDTFEQPVYDFLKEMENE